MRPVSYVWDPQDLDAICGLDDYGAGEIPINGTLSNIDTGAANPSVTFDRIARNVSITSTDDMHLVNFTITGLYNGNVVVDVVSGPNNSTVESDEIFNSITSVEIDDDVTNTSVGTGTIGHTNWFEYDYNRVQSGFAVQVSVVGTINYSFGATLESVSEVEDITEYNALNLFDLTGSLSSQTTDKYGNTGVIPFRYCNVEINSSGADGALEVIMCQGGI